jgi:hypothetical protein
MVTSRSTLSEPYPMLIVLLETRIKSLVILLFSADGVSLSMESLIPLNVYLNFKKRIPIHYGERPQQK